MDRETSIYLDLVRFASTMVVMVSHLSFERFSGGYLKGAFPLGHEAVILFFVLSGYVISYVADVKENNLKDYTISRLARLYSVVIPALLLVPLLDAIGGALDAALYADQTLASYFPLRLLANLLFLQEAWTLSVRYLSDAPLWSLGYEFWYYLLFSVFVFLEGRKRCLLLLAASLAAGPKILLLMVPWLMGVGVYRLHKTQSLDRYLARFLFLLALLSFPFLFHAYSGINMYMKALLTEPLQGRLGYSANYATDYITALLVAVNLFSFKYLQIDFLDKTLVSLEGLIRYLANSAFTIYLFHFPLFLFFTAALGLEPGSIIQMAGLFGVTLLSCLLLAGVTEKKKGAWKRYLTRLFDRAESNSRLFLRQPAK